ncbi:hypothetical protein H671_2g4763 [Cricetulus griseus]|nr:hypothetical protein H671_2g4763 [Cricetulus griseus]
MSFCCFMVFFFSLSLIPNLQTQCDQHHRLHAATMYKWLAEQGRFYASVFQETGSHGICVQEAARNITISSIQSEKSRSRQRDNLRLAATALKASATLCCAAHPKESHCQREECEPVCSLLTASSLRHICKYHVSSSAIG